jgi:hypothetical protein
MHEEMNMTCDIGLDEDPATAPHIKKEGESVAANDNSHVDDEHDTELFEIPEDLYPLFFPRWALMDTREAKLYRALYAEIEMVVKPQNIVDEMDVVEITDGFWQSQRIRNSIKDIIKAAQPDALAAILAPMVAHHFDVACEWSRDYYSDADKRESVRGLLRAHGMGPEAITAQAIAQRSPILQILNRTLASLGIRREDIMVAVAQRRDARGKKARRRPPRTVTP